jgi:hypothetical protein
MRKKVCCFTPEVVEIKKAEFCTEKKIVVNTQLIFLLILLKFLKLKVFCFPIVKLKL